MVLLHLKLRKSESEITEDAIRLLYAAYSLLPTEAVLNSINCLTKASLDKNVDLKDLEEVFQQLFASNDMTF